MDGSRRTTPAVARGATSMSSDGAVPDAAAPRSSRRALLDARHTLPRLLLVAACAVGLSISSCGPPPTTASAGHRGPAHDAPVPTSFRIMDEQGQLGEVMPMRGDPDFDRSRLSDLERYHFDRLWREIEDPDNAREVTRRAESDDLFTYGRWLQGHIQAVLTAFRVTGDLALLDHVDEVAEVMRGQLDYGWRDRPDGTDGTRGEFLLWVFRYGSGPSFYGTDNRIDDMKTHALVAMFAYAFDLNRDLASPGGRDYAASADFWKGYLEQFEAKLRVDGPASGFPITTHPDTHTWYSWTKWHYYMWKLTDDRAYLDEANRMADVLWADIRVVELDEGPAYVWTSNIAQESDRRQYLMTTPYANSVFGDVVTFHLEGFHEWAYTEHITAYARTLTHFVFDSEDVLSHGVAADIGGDADRAGIPSDSGRPRRDAVGFADYQFALIAPWDESGRVARVAYEVQETFTERDTTRVAAGLLLGAHLEPQATASAIASASP